MTAWRCPWCDALRRTERTRRDHLAMNECGHIALDDRIGAILRCADTYSESEWERTLIGVFREAGWQCFHVPRMRGRDGDWFTNTSEPGLPDWLLIKPPDLVIIEVKKQDGKASKEQVRVVKRLQQCTRVIAGFGRPTDAVTLLPLACRGLPIEDRLARTE